MNWASLGTFFIKYKRQIIIGLLILTILIIIRRNWYKIGQFFKPKAPSLIDDEGQGSTPLTQEQLNKIYGIAGKLYNDIYETGWTGHTYEPYGLALTLTDRELLELARYYKRNLSNGNSLYSDIGSQIYVWSDGTPAELRNKLSKIGEL